MYIQSEDLTIQFNTTDTGNYYDNYPKEIYPANDGRVYEEPYAFEYGYKDYFPLVRWLYADCEMLSFSLQSGASSYTGQIVGTAITVIVPYGTSLGALVATFTLSTGATAFITEVRQTSGATPNNFESAVDYKVVAEFPFANQIYTVNVEVLPNAECEILSFAIGENIGMIVGQTITVNVPNTTDLTGLVATFILSEGAQATINSLRPTIS